METIGRQARRARDLGEFDALVYGGGLSGWAAAVSLARAGRSVLLAAEHTALGHEVWAAMSVWAPPDATLPVPEVWREARDILEAAKAARGPFVDPVATEVVTEQMAREAGVRILLQVTAHADGDGLTLLAGKWGLMAARPQVVIDASARGRLAAEMGATLEPRATDEPVVRRALMVHTGVTEPREMAVGEGLPLRGPVMAWPTMWPGDVVIEAEFDLPAEDLSALDVQTRRALAEVAARLRAADEAFGQGSLMHIAHDPVLPRDQVLVPGDDAEVATQVECESGVIEVTRGALQPSGTRRLVAASPAIAVGALSARASQYAPNAVRLGEAAATSAQQLLDGGAA